MKYDFNTLIDRSNQSSDKWLLMKQTNPAVQAGIPPLSVADMDMKHPPQFLEGMKQYIEKTVMGYTAPSDEYFDAVIKWMNRRHNWKIEKEWILITSGIIPAIHNLIQAFTEKGDGVIVLTPVYYPFYRAIETNGRKIVDSSLNNTTGEYRIDFDDLEKKAKDPKNKLILFCSPHNPVGRVWTRAELERVGQICLEHNVQIISDEIHFDLIMPGNQHTVFASISKELMDNVITCTAPSKSFNLAGMMTSNIIIPNKEKRGMLHKQLEKNGAEVWSPIGFEACRLSYELCEDWLDELILHIQHNYEALSSFVEENLPKVKLYPLQGTYLAWLDFSYLGLTNEKLEHLMTQEAQVFFDEGYIFGENGSGFERINIACPTNVMIEAMERIKSAIEKLSTN
ncbi:cystathionine beta-lyase [Clostridiales Family XIII bacterium PM5-7]